jgi:hypothetical protein
MSGLRRAASRGQKDAEAEVSVSWKVRSAIAFMSAPAAK